MIIPTTGERRLLLNRALHSCQQQFVKPTIIIVIDDGIRQSVSIDKAEFSHLEINLLRTGGGRGGGHARNVGLSHARLNFPKLHIAFLDDDDVWYHEKISTQLEILHDHNADVVGSRYTTEKRNIGKGKQAAETVSSGVIYSNCKMSPSTLLVNGKVSHLLKFDESLKAWQGRDLFIQMYIHGFSIIRSERILVYQDQNHGNSRISDQTTERYVAMNNVVSKYEPILGRYLADFLSISIHISKLKQRRLDSYKLSHKWSILFANKHSIRLYFSFVFLLIKKMWKK